MSGKKSGSPSSGNSSYTGELLVKGIGLALAVAVARSFIPSSVDEDDLVETENDEPAHETVSAATRYAAQRTGAIAPFVTVREGDTLWNLSMTYNIPIDTIRDANGIVEDHIRAGEELFLPGAVRTPNLHFKPLSSFKK